MKKHVSLYFLFLFFSLSLVKAETSINSSLPQQEMTVTEAKQKLKALADSLPDMSAPSPFRNAPINLKESENDLVFFKKSGLIYPEKMVNCREEKYAIRLISAVTDKASLTCISEDFDSISNSFLEYYSNHGWEVYNEGPKKRISMRYMRIVLKKGHVEFLVTITETSPNVKKLSNTSFLFERFNLASKTPLLDFIKKTK